MIECEICGKPIEEGKEIDVTLADPAVGHVTFHIHERCIVGMGVKSRRLLEELRNQGE